MPVEYVQNHHFTLLENIPAGGMQFITETLDPLPPGPPQTTHFRHWPLDPQFPRKALINRILIYYESDGYNTLQAMLQYPPGSDDALHDLREYAYHLMKTLQWLASRTNMETTAWVDPGGRHYSTAVPQGAENSSEPIIMLMHEFEPNPQMNYDSRDFRYPVPLDRDAGDRIAVQVNNADLLNWLFVVISFLVPAPFQPQ
jgi:hypothetical protein